MLRVLLLCALVVCACINGAGAESGKIPINIGAYVPINAEGGITRFAISSVAVQDFNREQSITVGGADAELVLVPYTETNLTSENNDAKFFIKNNVVAIVGPTTSDFATRVARVFGGLELPQVSYSATSAALSNAELYPYFLRTVADDTMQVQVFLDLIARFNWAKVGFLYTTESYGSYGFKAFMEAKPAELTVVDAAFETSETCLSQQLKKFERNGVKVVFTMVATEGCGMMYNQILNSTMVQEGYAWVHSDTCSQVTAASIAADNVEKMVGMLGVQPFKGEGAAYEDFVSRVADTDLSFEDSVRADPYAVYNYDAIFAIGHALKNCTDAFDGSLSPLTINQPALLECLKHVRFAGLSGEVQFQTPLENKYVVVNWNVANVAVPVLSYECASREIQYISPIVWLGGLDAAQPVAEASEQEEKEEEPSSSESSSPQEMLSADEEMQKIFDESEESPKQRAEEVIPVTPPVVVTPTAVNATIGNVTIVLPEVRVRKVHFGILLGVTIPIFVLSVFACVMFADVNRRRRRVARDTYAYRY